MQRKTAIETLIESANEDVHGSGFHITARFPDGSIVDAPCLSFGPDWMEVADLEDEPTMIPTGDASSLKVNWDPGKAYAEGPRFEHLDAPRGRPDKGMTI